MDNSGTATLTNSTVSGNSAYDGGGVYNSGTLTLTNSTVSGNSLRRRRRRPTTRHPHPGPHADLGQHHLPRYPERG